MSHVHLFQLSSCVLDGSFLTGINVNNVSYFSFSYVIDTFGDFFLVNMQDLLF